MRKTRRPACTRWGDDVGPGAGPKPAGPDREQSQGSAPRARRPADSMRLHRIARRPAQRTQGHAGPVLRSWPRAGPCSKLVSAARIFSVDKGGVTAVARFSRATPPPMPCAPRPVAAMAERQQVPECGKSTVWKSADARSNPKASFPLAFLCDS